MGQKKVVTIATTSEAEISKTSTKTALEGAKTQKGAKALHRVNFYINATYNNTLITAADEKGNVIAAASAGALGFSGPKKSTPYASAQVANAVTEKLKKYAIGEAYIFVSGVGQGRESAIRTLGNNGFNIVTLKDVTPVPHNGPRPPKPRRV